MRIFYFFHRADPADPDPADPAGTTAHPAAIFFRAYNSPRCLIFHFSQSPHLLFLRLIKDCSRLAQPAQPSPIPPHFSFFSKCSFSIFFRTSKCAIENIRKILGLIEDCSHLAQPVPPIFHFIYFFHFFQSPHFLFFRAKIAAIQPAPPAPPAQHVFNFQLRASTLQLLFSYSLLP